MNRFLAYGITIHTSLDLSERLDSGPPTLHQVEICESLHPEPEAQLAETMRLGPGHGREIMLCTDREFAQAVSGQRWQFEVGSIVRLHWNSGNRKVSFQRLETCTDELLAFWVIHIFLPIYLSLEGVCELLHACAVEVDGEAILFTGPSYGGKSTLTDYFLGKGHTLVSDDKVAVYRDGTAFLAAPSHPNHRPYRRFEDLGRRVSRFSNWPRPIRLIYLLRAGEPDAEVRIREIFGHEKVTCIVPSHMFNIGVENGTRLRFVAELMRSVRVCEIGIPRNLDRLEEVYSAIRVHIGE